MSNQINAGFNDLINAMSLPLQEGMLLHLSTKDLACLRASCKIFNEVVMENPKSRERLDLQFHLEYAEDWLHLPYSTIGDRNYQQFSIRDLPNAANWLRNRGDVKVPSNGLGFLCDSMHVREYISVMRYNDRIYYHLWKIKGSPEGDIQFGEKAFCHRDGLESSASEQAEACERFVVEQFLREHPPYRPIPWESRHISWESRHIIIGEFDARPFMKYPGGGFEYLTMETLLNFATWMREKKDATIFPGGLGTLPTCELSPSHLIEELRNYGLHMLSTAEAIERFIIQEYVLVQPSRLAIRLGRSLDFQKKLHYVKEWASQATVQVNPEFLNPADPQQECPRGVAPHFTMQTILNAAKWLRQKGDAPIPHHGLGIFQPNELSAFSYILGMDNLEGIYHQLWKVKGSPQGIDDQYGEKAFRGIDGFQSTNEEKAEACERFVLQSYLNS